MHIDITINSFGINSHSGGYFQRRIINQIQRVRDAGITNKIYRNKIIFFVQIININIAAGYDNAVANSFIYVNRNILHTKFGAAINIMNIRHSFQIMQISVF